MYTTYIGFYCRPNIQVGISKHSNPHDEKLVIFCEMRYLYLTSGIDKL